MRIGILGGGESGVGAAILAKKQGHAVFLSDSGVINGKYTRRLSEWGIDYEQSGHTEARLLDQEEVIKSPGISNENKLVKTLVAEGVPITGEIEFASRYCTSHITAVTGSNGKTTTSLLIYHILKAGGLSVGLAGNIGSSFAYQVATEQFDYYVLEVSSFQLDDVKSFRANIAVLTNITPDHLDRYSNNLDLYAAAKFKIVKNQQSEDYFLFCSDDPETVKRLKLYATSARSLPFSIKSDPDVGAFPGASSSDDQLFIHLPNSTFNMPLSELALAGRHNFYNSMAAGLASKILGIKNDVIRASLADFQNVEHRLEYVSTVQGIVFINDSKATNVNSAWYAMESMQTPIIWIAGGIDKGNDYEMLHPMVRSKVKAIVCLGKNNELLHRAFGDKVDIIVDAPSAEQAVLTAYHLGKKGDTVLLSPACASFDLFVNYEDRGNQFKSAVRQL